MPLIFSVPQAAHLRAPPGHPGPWNQRPDGSVVASHRMHLSFTVWVESGNALILAEADARLKLDDDWDSGCSAGTEARCCACWMAIVGASVFLSA